MKVRLQFLAAAGVVAAAVTLIPLDALAQGRRGGGGGGRVAQPRPAPRVVVPRTVVRGYYARPVYGGAFYRPFFYDPWFGAYYGGGPFGYWGGYPFAPGVFGAAGVYGGGWDVGSSLRIQASPRETEVFVDGYFAGVVDDFDGVFQRLRLESGEHTIQLFHPGYRPVVEKLYLQPGTTTRLREQMEPLRPGDPEPARPAGAPRPGSRAADVRRTPPPDLPPPPDVVPPDAVPPPPPGPRELSGLASGFGQLALRVQPGDAEIFVDGERWEGSSAGDRLEIEIGAGTHHLEIRRPGYRTYLSDVNVRDGQQLPINVVLTRQ